MEIKLGQKVKCKVTGIQGIVTAKCEYINGCVHYGVTPPSTDGKYPDTSYIDYQQLEIIDDGIFSENTSEDNVSSKASTKRGGPQINAPRC